MGLWTAAELAGAVAGGLVGGMTMLLLGWMAMSAACALIALPVLVGAIRNQPTGDKAHRGPLVKVNYLRIAGLVTAAIALPVASCDRNLLQDKLTVVSSGPVQLRAVAPFSATDLVNPKRGQYQDFGVTLYPQSTTSSYPAWPGTDDAGDRFLWSQIQPTSADTYDFTVIDNEIAAASAHNERFHFRSMAFASCCGDSGNIIMGVPAWLHATPGATTDYHSGGKRMSCRTGTPRPTSPRSNI